MFVAMEDQGRSGPICFTAIRCRSARGRWRTTARQGRWAAQQGSGSGSGSWPTCRAHLRGWRPQRGQPRLLLDAGVLLVPEAGRLGPRVARWTLRRLSVRAGFAPVAARRPLRRFSSLRSGSEFFFPPLQMALRRLWAARGCGTAGVSSTSLQGAPPTVGGVEAQDQAPAVSSPPGPSPSAAGGEQQQQRSVCRRRPRGQALEIWCCP